MIDNFKLISDFIRGKSAVGEFYFLQILKRRKDNPNLGRDMISITHYLLRGADHLELMKDEIIEMCTANNARAYFHLNRRCYEKVAIQTMALVATNIAAHQYNIGNCFLSCCGQYHCDDAKTWVVDIDNMNEKQDVEIQHFINHLPPNSGQKIIMNLPTKNGHHLITTPFRMDMFKDKYPTIDVHKDNPTLLYIS